MKTLLKSLANVQLKLKANKNQFNSFGKYAYRNCEDILQAVKPLLKDNVILLQDDIVMVGDRIYVKATAVFTDGENSITATAFAREPEDRKGMDESQITGSASSYARKYSLNGLLLIDDNKDVDSSNEYADEAEQYHDLIESGEAFQIYMFTQSMTIEERSGLWQSYKAEYIGKGAIGSTKARIAALSAAGREEGLRALDAFQSEEDGVREEALECYTEEEISFIQTLSGE